MMPSAFMSLQAIAICSTRGKLLHGERRHAGGGAAACESLRGLLGQSVLQTSGDVMCGLELEAVAR